MRFSHSIGAQAISAIARTLTFFVTVPLETCHPFFVSNPSSRRQSVSGRRPLCPSPSLLSRTVACVGHDGGECLHGEPDLARVMETERDPEKLLRVWARWRDAAGAGEK